VTFIPRDLAEPNIMVKPLTKLTPWRAASRVTPQGERQLVRFRRSDSTRGAQQVSDHDAAAGGGGSQSRRETVTGEHANHHSGRVR
jgi:hypothetical protein